MQLLAADAADAAKFNGIPQKSGGKGSASKIKVNSNVNGVSSPTSVTSQMPKESQGKVSPIIRSNYVVPGAVLVPSGNGTIRQANLFGEKFDASAWLEQTQRNDQGNVWTEMDHLRGRESMSAGEIQDTLHKVNNEEIYVETIRGNLIFRFSLLKCALIFYCNKSVPITSVHGHGGLNFSGYSW